MVLRPYPRIYSTHTVPYPQSLWLGWTWELRTWTCKIDSHWVEVYGVGHPVTGSERPVTKPQPRKLIRKSSNKCTSLQDFSTWVTMSWKYSENQVPLYIYRKIVQCIRNSGINHHDRCPFRLSPIWVSISPIDKNMSVKDGIQVILFGPHQLDGASPIN